MSVYFFNIVIMVLSYYVWIYYHGKNKGSFYFCCQAAIQWILLSGLRAYSIGADTERYKVIFDSVSNMSFSEILSAVSQCYFGETIIKDPGYYLFVKIFQIFCDNYTIFLLFVAAIFMILFSRWVYRYSSNVLISFIIYSTLFYSFFSITGIRQTIVTAVIVFIGSELIEKKKYFMFYFLIFILFPIHKSVIAFSIFPLIIKIPINKIMILIWSILFGLSWIFKSTFMTLLSSVVGYDQYDVFISGAGPYTYTFMFMSVLFVAIILKDYIHKIKQKCSINVVYNSIFIALILLPLVFINQSAMRAVQYYSLFLVLIVPMIISVIKKNQQDLVVFGLIIVLVVMLLNNNPTYSFFWQ